MRYLSREFLFPATRRYARNVWKKETAVKKPWNRYTLPCKYIVAATVARDGLSVWCYQLELWFVGIAITVKTLCSRVPTPIQNRLAGNRGCSSSCRYTFKPMWKVAFQLVSWRTGRTIYGYMLFAVGYSVVRHAVVYNLVRGTVFHRFELCSHWDVFICCNWTRDCVIGLKVDLYLPFRYTGGLSFAQEALYSLYVIITNLLTSTRSNDYYNFLFFFSFFASYIIICSCIYLIDENVMETWIHAVGFNCLLMNDLTLKRLK